MKPTVAITLIALTGFAHAGSREVRLTECPAAVQATINANLRDGTIDEIESYAVENRSLYVAEVELPNGRDLKIHVAADGKLVKTREDSVLSESPPAVQKVVEGMLANGGRVDDVDKEIAGKSVTFHIEIERPGAPDLQVALSNDGKIISEKEEIDD